MIPTLYIALSIIGATIFLTTFYLSVYWGSERRELEDRPEDYPRVSVIMPAYNEGELVEETLEAALNIDYPDYEVILVDDGSTDSTLEKARRFEDEKLQIISHDRNRGKAAALNTGLAQADSKYTVVQDADSAIGAELVERAVARMEADRELGAVIGAIGNFSEDTFAKKLQRVQYQLTNFYRNLMSDIRTLDVTPGAFSMYRTGELRELGGFDVGNPTEDLEMAWRLREHGKNLDMVYERNSKTKFPSTFGDLYRQRVRWKRGSIVNSLKYRHMFFNSEYGWFGRFQLPVHVLGPLLTVVSLALIGYGIGEILFNTAIRFSAVGFSLPSFQVHGLYRMFLGQQLKIYAPLMVGMVLSAYVIRTAYREAGTDIRSLKAVGFFYLWFFVLEAFFSIAAIIKELLGTKRTWS